MQVCPNCKSTRIGSFRIDSDWGSGGDWYATNLAAGNAAGYTVLDIKAFNNNERPDIECCVCCECSTCFEPTKEPA